MHRQSSNANSPSVIKMKTNWLEERKTWATNQLNNQSTMDGLATHDKPSSFLQLLRRQRKTKQSRRCLKMFSASQLMCDNHVSPQQTPGSQNSPLYGRGNKSQWDLCSSASPCVISLNVLKKSLGNRPGPQLWLKGILVEILKKSLFWWETREKSSFPLFSSASHFSFLFPQSSMSWV